MINTISTSHELETASIQVQFLYWEDCPSHERALEILNDVIKSEGIDAEISIRKVETEEEAEALGFPGSPTIRIAGSDIDESPSPFIGLTCRVYVNENGKISPLPSRAKIAAALHSAREAA
ncbi:MAG: hypothetical protein NVSMB52_03430 [Chloroflexota bacterium]